MALTYTDLGNIMIAEVGLAACQSGYLTTEPAEVGRLALGFMDIDADGTLT